MAKKSFKNNPAMDYISTQDTQEIQNAPEEHKEQKVQEVQDTQGLSKETNVQHVQASVSQKKEKAPRINMAFKPKNLEYLRIVSRLKGYTITDYINYLIEADMAEGDNVQLLREAELFLKRVSKTNSK